ncbi:translation machinery-associated protein 16 [Anaerocolumna aminovalerica]|nr:translation machinery-associated protein 16 [Anaerocolumna aminovalerica]
MEILLMYGKEMVLAEEFETGVEIPDITFNITL